MQPSLFSIPETLSNLQIKALNEMQEAAIKACNQSNDVVLLSDTGSGKTLAFLLPVAQLLDKNRPVTQALIVVSSRELALQIEHVFKKMGKVGFQCIRFELFLKKFTWLKSLCNKSSSNTSNLAFTHQSSKSRIKTSKAMTLKSWTKSLDSKANPLPILS